MALIKRIRENSGVAVGLVALGLGLFIVGGDILGPNSMLLGQSDRHVGEIAGEKISIEEFNQQVEEMKYNFLINTQRNPSDNEMSSLRQQAWDFLIVKTAFQKEYDKLGIAVTDQELVDMVQGKNIRPEIQQAFSDPETGEISREAIRSYLRDLKNRAPQEQSAWFLFESNLKPSRLRLKYDYLMIQSAYVPKAEARKAYNAENTVAEVKYLYIPYSNINDSLVQVSDSELKDHIRKNKTRYQMEDSRSAKYIRFSLQASKEDTAYIKQDLNELKDEFRKAEVDSVFARINSDGFDPFRSYSIGELPDPLKANISNLSEGDVRGPYLVNNNYVLYKVSGINDDTVASARASHILVRAKGTTNDAKQVARNEANRILTEIRSGASFAEMAREYSEDPSSTRGGDLGWFEKGRMVQPFEEAVFNARNTGLVNRVIETEYGFHIINVTELPTRRSFTIASIEREVLPSDATRNEAYRRADRFASMVSNLKEFEQQAVKDSLNVLSVKDVRKNDRRMNTFPDARNVIMWMFNDASVGSVSQVFELDNEYVVAVLTEKTEAGLASVDKVREQVTREVIKEKQGDMIIQKLKDLSGNLDEIASAYGEDANVYSSSSLSLNANTLPTVGAAPKAIGAVFALEEGERTSPVKGDNGVVILELMALTEPPSSTDIATYQDQVLQRRTESTSYYLLEAIKEFSEIEDNRVKFY